MLSNGPGHGSGDGEFDKILFAGAQWPPFFSETINLTLHSELSK